MSNIIERLTELESVIRSGDLERAKQLASEVRQLAGPRMNLATRLAHAAGLPRSNTELRSTLGEFARHCLQHLNGLAIPHQIGTHRLSLSPRSLSDVTEKHVVDCMMSYYGPGAVESRNWRGYDAIITVDALPVLVNVKTVESVDVDGIWLATATVTDSLRHEGHLDHLFVIRFDYRRDEGGALRFFRAGVAGPIGEIPLYRYTKGDQARHKIRQEYNGTHDHVLNEHFGWVQG